MQAPGERHVQAIGQKGDEDVGLDARRELVKDRPDGEIAFEVLEDLFDGDQQQIVAPQLGRVLLDQVGAQQISALARACASQLLAVEALPERGTVCRHLDDDQTPGFAVLITRRAELHQQLLAAERHVRELLEPGPQPLQLPPPDRPLLSDAVEALGEDVELAVLRQQLYLDPGTRRLQGSAIRRFSRRVRRPFGVPTR